MSQQDISELEKTKKNLRDRGADAKIAQLLFVMGIKPRDLLAMHVLNLVREREEAEVTQEEPYEEEDRISNLLRAVKSLNTARRRINEEKILLSGARSREIEALQETVEGVAKNLYKNKVLVENLFTSVMPYLQSEADFVTRSSLRAALESHYLEGLRATVVMYSRVTPVQTLNPIDIITSYTSSFITMLKVCQRFAISPKTALTLAQGSYRVDGRKLVQLFENYTGVPSNIITHAAIRNNADPEGFLNKFVATIARLSSDPSYQHLTPKTISNAAWKYPDNPERYLDRIQRTKIKPVARETLEAMSLGKYVQYCRKRLGLTQQELAIAAALHQSMLTRFESDKRILKPENIEKLRIALNLEGDELALFNAKIEAIQAVQ